MVLCDRPPSNIDEASVRSAIEILERWTVVQSAKGTYRMHDAHSEFGRESLMDRGDVRRLAVQRWTTFISSLDALRSNDGFVLERLWLAVERVGGKGWSRLRPHATALDGMDDSDPLLMKSLEVVGWFQDAQDDWEGASTTCRRLLTVQQRKLGVDDPKISLTLSALAFRAEQLGKTGEKERWQAEERSRLPLVAARMQAKFDAGEVDGVQDAVGASAIALTMLKAAGDDGLNAEKLVGHSLAILEAELGENDVRVAYTL